MAPRRTHTKSRNGCDQCKRRRVKCDEKGPPCSNCTSRELQCSYLRAPPRDGHDHGHGHGDAPPRPNTSISTRDSGTPRPAAPISPAASTPSTISPVRDLELMHQFSTDTFRTLCTGPLEFEVWQITIPRLALRYDFLMNGILAVASLHLATIVESPTSLAYIDTALQYHNLTFGPFRIAIDNLTPQNCEAVLAQSIITTVIGIALPWLTGSRDERSNMTENIVTVFELLQGVRKIMQIGRSWIKLSLFSRQKELWDSGPTELDSETAVALNRLMTLNDETLASIDTDQYRINKDVITHLRHCFTLFGNSQDPANVLAWLAAVDKEFVDNVRRRQPLALLILMHWGVLLGELDGQRWWARNSGKALVSELLRVLYPVDARWAGSLIWPRHKMGL
ncbi:hypothetical protein N7509_006589 [Penicillium cosmopolitanum]|uniref:Zn(2)-C6 fungal-type domain-containing protein n=1 Tax=Penicillium cosmopolitanum TaxID=1131564 RepID=A0A9X0B7K7_9EURO|nr:uncharacterized protein N7509_006589 [Penicillium cosmopolitanum]KAJ5391099.1 hypothetical protein N7509_006589 [Penicillium cosmopolitanum]